MFRLSIISRLILRSAQFQKNVLSQAQVSSVFVRKFSDKKKFTSKNLDVSGIKGKNPDDAIEKDLLAAQDPDTFGTLSVNVQKADDDLVDPDDIKEEQYLKHPPKRSQKLRIKEYADLIKDHLNNNRIMEAIDVLEVRMIKEDRVQPETYIYNLLISGCARVGYSKKAFQLYTKMKQRGLKVTGGTYTSLFNACATAPFLNDGLQKANRLREIMIEKGYEPNASNYNAMIKAYGRCGDVKTAFLLVDEMIGKDLPIQIETFNFLLQACASDSEVGFRHALLVWHKMYQRKLSPNIYSFNLMLRCCRDTNLGDLETTEEVIHAILKSGKIVVQEQPLIEEGKISGALVQNQNQVSSDPTPNLLSITPHLGNLIELKEIQRPEDRLLLLGGLSGFLKTMNDFEVKPDIKTFTELLETIPPTIAAEKKLISTIKKAGIKCDIDFFNILIKKRSMRFDYESARDVLDMIHLARLEPDIVTYGVLSLGCKTIEEARELMETMREKEIKMNVHILGAMMRQGCSQLNFQYVLEILDIVKKEKIKPSEKFLTHLDNFHNACKKILKTRNKLADRRFKIDFNNFKQNVEQWKVDMGLDDLSLEESCKKVKGHPWEQFQEPQAGGFEDLKNPKLRKKKKKFHNIRKIEAGDEEGGQKMISSD